MTGPPLAAPADQSVTFVELFFDLVFVFSVTNVTALLHGGITWPAVGRGLLVFWLVWWAWTQFTWALNAANTDHPRVRAATLVATGLAFFVAVAVPDAFGSGARWFALAYVAVRVLGLLVYVWVAGHHPGQRRAVRTFGLVSVTGLVAVLAGGLVGGPGQYALWALAIGLDLVAATAGARSESWDVHPAHFSERHGLIVIIALGESLIVAGAGLADAEWTGALLAVGALAVALTCALWWTYFPAVKPALEHALQGRSGAEQSNLARDAFTLTHFPMLCGVIAVAAVVEEAVAHPHEALHLSGRAALAAGLALFVGGAALALWRACGPVPRARLALVAVTALAVLGVAGVPPWASLAIGLAGLAALGVVESRPSGPG